MSVKRLSFKNAPRDEVHEREALVLSRLDVLELEQRVEVEAHGAALVRAGVEEVADDQRDLEDRQQQVAGAHLLKGGETRGHVRKGEGSLSSQA